MHKLFNSLVDSVPLRHKITVRKAQLRYMRFKRLAGLCLSFAFAQEV
jgi:hypothetical protein